MNQGQVYPAMYVFDIPGDTDNLDLGDEWADYGNKDDPEIAYFAG